MSKVNLILPDSKEKKEKTPTVGEKAYELLTDKNPLSLTAEEIREEADKEFIKEMEDVIQKNQHRKGKYYIQIVLKKERVSENIIRRYLIPRESEPLADYDTTLYSFDNRDQKLRYHWTVPDPTTCHYLLTNEHSLPEAEKPLLEMVKKFSAGQLA